MTDKHILKIENLKKSFGGVHAVDGCSVEVPRGKITALIGPNGSGKTTVFNLISGTIKADGGKIIFNDKKISNLSPEVISNLGISRVFQQSRLFVNLSVFDNLLIAFDNEDQKFWKSVLGLNSTVRHDKEKVIKEMLESVRLGHMLDKPAKDLSFGQKRLAELLRAMINPHDLLMLDEPIAGVTPELRDKIRGILSGVRGKGETVLLIEHDMNFTLRVADYVVVMDAGKVIASGSPDEIKTNSKVLEAYLD